jgi:hypothetical protein
MCTESFPKKILFGSIWLRPQNKNVSERHERQNLSLSITTMASNTITPEPENLPKFSVTIITRLTVHTQNKKKITKETKTKEFTHLFSATKANYAELLNAILAKHHIGGKLTATERQRYRCKIHVPPDK